MYKYFYSKLYTPLSQDLKCSSFSLSKPLHALLPKDANKKCWPVTFDSKAVAKEATKIKSKVAQKAFKGKLGHKHTCFVQDTPQQKVGLVVNITKHETTRIVGDDKGNMQEVTNLPLGVNPVTGIESFAQVDSVIVIPRAVFNACKPTPGSVMPSADVNHIVENIESQGFVIDIDSQGNSTMVFSTPSEPEIKIDPNVFKDI